jgi:ATP-binding cassette subfamily B (MDR/TAP) protein 1
MISAFSYWGDKLRSSTNFLCLMLVVVAVGVGLSYFALGWTSNTLSAVSFLYANELGLAKAIQRTVATYRKEYFCNTITKPVSFFDDEDHSLGMLTARLATDPTQLQQLLGLNMAMVCISIFNVVGCVTISFYFGWKFALVMICASLPVILVCGWYRVRHEVRFEVRNNEVFKESAGFATEAIRATRTVASLTLERVICKRYEALLEEHIGKEARDARVSVAVFAASDSLVLLCMAFALW